LFVEIIGELGVHLRVGSEVTCLFGEGRLRNTAFSTVSSEAPLFLDCVASDVQRVRFPRKVVLVSYENGRLLRGEAEAVSMKKVDGHARLEMAQVVWEDLDRRRHQRVNVELPVSLRAVYEHNGDTVLSVVDGATVDLSVGGSRVHVETPILEGSLVEFLVEFTPKESIRALGIVAHANPDKSIGISFLDYVGAARTRLEDFLAEKAA
jgi:hypothetical protein